FSAWTLGFAWPQTAALTSHPCHAGGLSTPPTPNAETASRHPNETPEVSPILPADITCLGDTSDIPPLPVPLSPRIHSSRLLLHPRSFASSACRVLALAPAVGFACLLMERFASFVALLRRVTPRLATDDDRRKNQRPRVAAHGYPAGDIG